MKEVLLGSNTHLQECWAEREDAATPPPALAQEGPSLVVFSGGTAFNSVAGGPPLL
jgi:hypothetical protein